VCVCVILRQNAMFPDGTPTYYRKEKAVGNKISAGHAWHCL